MPPKTNNPKTKRTAPKEKPENKEELKPKRKPPKEKPENQEVDKPEPKRRAPKKKPESKEGAEPKPKRKAPKEKAENKEETEPKRKRRTPREKPENKGDAKTNGVKIEAEEQVKGRKAEPKAKVLAKNEESDKKKIANKTTTNWELINFKCDKKNKKGELPNFHIISWNVDGVRAWLKKGGLEILAHSNADIFCLQETKCSVEKLPEEIQNIEGYKAYWAESKKEGYAGVGILTKVMPIDVTYGIKDAEHDQEGRIITAEFKNFYLVNVYVPNAGRKLITLDKRLDWNIKFMEFIKNLNKRKTVIICGDMNVAHKEIDLTNPKTNTKNAGFTPEERQGMTEFLAEGYSDTYRELYPDKTGAYTFWSYFSNARSKNIGWRLDYFIVPNAFMDNVCDNVIHTEAFGSDHCPVSLYFKN